MIDIDTLHTFDTQYSADSVEWCKQPQLEKFFAVGTYQLEQTEKSGSSRKGRIYLFHYENQTNVLTECQRIETEAILDQKWRGDLLVTATSFANIDSYKLNEENQLRKVSRASLAPEESDVLALSLDLHEETTKAVVSISKGEIMLLDLEADETNLRQWKAHEFEAWTCCFNRHNNDVIFSGGDDSTLKVWDVRIDSKASLLKSTKRDAGVTSLLSHKENILLVGSYDEKLCAFDLRNLKQPADEINLKGGIWRIKASPANSNHLLVACMYHNFSIVDFNDKLKLIGEYFGHDSICYGCDWMTKNESDCQIFASCSFYDHKMNVCKVKL